MTLYNKRILEIQTTIIPEQTAADFPHSLLNQLGRFDMAFMAVLWDVILERMDAANKYIQGVDIELGSAVQLYDSSIEYFQAMRNHRF